jgi:hypothetical protein
VLTAEFYDLQNAAELQYTDYHYTAKPYDKDFVTYYKIELEIVFKTELNPDNMFKIEWNFIIDENQNDQKIDFSFLKENIIMYQPPKISNKKKCCSWFLKN